MAGSLSEIKAKIASTKKTRQITSAMQMVSAAKLTQSEDITRQFRVYAEKVRHITSHLVQSELLLGSTHPMIQARPVQRTGYIVITSDKGLVGGYNSSILKTMMDTIKNYHQETNDFEIIALGGMGADFFKARGIPVAFELRDLDDHPSFEDVRQIISRTVSMYQEELFDELYVCYTHHINSLSSQVRMQQMLPIRELDSNQTSEANLFELEPHREAILDQLLPQYTESLIYGAIVDAKTAEHAAGMSAMQTATDNAKNVITDLTIQYNRARQAAITQEITEIVAGANALE